MKYPRTVFTVALLLATAAANAAPVTFQAFEGDGFDDWQTTGNAFGLSPVHGKLDGLEKELKTYANEAFALSAHGGMDATGTLTSPEFTISQPYIAFLIAGGDQAGKTCVQLIVDDKVVKEATGKRSPIMEAAQFDVTALMGKKARLRAVDEAKGDWGFIAMDHVIFNSYANNRFPSSTKGGKPFVAGLISTPALAGATIPEGTTMKVEADFKKQGIKSPTALTFDEQGNIYVAETHRFRHGIEDDRNNLFWYLDDLAAMTTDDRLKLHEKWYGKVSKKFMTEKSEVIRRFSDTNGDGTYDKINVFSDGYNDVLDGTAAGVFFYDGALYFACIPKIYMLRDTDNDGVADEKKTVEEGFGVRISLSGHDLNGFTLGPDGRIYGTIGDRGYSLITKEGKEYKYPNEGAAFRFEPDGTGFEIFHTGLRNPKEIAFDEFGDAFSVDNNSDQGDKARIVYLVEGGETGWQMEHQTMHTFHRSIGLEQRPPNRWMDEKMWEMRNDTQPAYILPPSALLTAGPSGLTYHPGTGFLKSEKGRFLICDYKGGAASSGIWSFEMEPDGAGMKMTDARQFNWGVAATDVEYSFDGRVFVTDFVTGWQSHDEGRLISISAGDNMYLPDETKQAAKLISEGFDQRESAELAKLLAHADSRVRIRAQVALTRKPDTVAFFKKATESENQIERIHGIWGLGIVARRGSVPSSGDGFAPLPKKGLREEAANAILPLLKDPDPEIRTQALRVIADGPLAGNSLPLGTLLSDDSPRVRFAAGIAIGKMKALGHYSAVVDFISKNNNRDLFLRHAGIYALEHITTNPRQLSALASSDSAALRLAAVVALRRLNNSEIARFLNDPDPNIQDEVIRAIHDLDMNDVRPLAAALLDDLSKREWTPFMLRRLIHNAYRVGTDMDGRRLLDVMANSSLPEEVRAEALRLITLWEKPFPADQFTGHWRPLAPRPLDTLKPSMDKALPALLKGDGLALAGALDLIDQYHLDVASLDDASLLAIVANPELPGEARARALSLTLQRDIPDLNTLLSKSAADPSDEVALEALAALAKRDPKSALAAAESAVDSSSVHRSQKAWEVLASIPGEGAAAFIASHLDKLKQASGVSASAIELLAAAKSRSEPSVLTKLAAFDKAMAESSDPLARHNVSLEGGDPTAGAALFSSHPVGQCMRCHKAEDKAHSGGGDAGPNLAGIAKRYDRRYLLESIVNPSAAVTPGYGITSVTFKNGATLGGTLVKETPDHLDIATPEKLLRAKRSDIESFTPPVSAMPPMGDLIKPEEIRDLVAWLASLGKESAKAPSRKPELVDPSKLPGAKPQSSVPAPEPAPIPVAAQDNTPEPIATEAVAPEPISPEFAKLGAQQYMLCGACHGQQGEGTAAGPPLAGSEWVTGPAENLIRIQLRGLTGPIKVKGKEYNFPAGMMPMAYQTDEQIAAVLTHIRSSFGNTAPAVAASEVTAFRSEVGQPQLTAAELIQPEQPAAKSEDAESDEAKPSKYDNMKTSFGAPLWLFAGIVLFGLFCLLSVFRK
jgi:quinoprotein glucose dehydrogenase